MPRSVAKPLPEPNYCRHCGDRLTLSNKSKPPRCYNESACEVRVRSKPPTVIKPEPGVRVPSAKIGQVLLAVTERFGFTMEELRRHDKLSKYTRARKILYYLLVRQAKITCAQAAVVAGDRCEATIYQATLEVAKSMSLYAEDIRAIETRCNELAELSVTEV